MRDGYVFSFNGTMYTYDFEPYRGMYHVVIRRAGRKVSESWTNLPLTRKQAYKAVQEFA